MKVKIHNRSPGIAKRSHNSKPVDIHQCSRTTQTGGHAKVGCTAA
jgi:hypothetical protein